jgi:hypothetical protein
MKNKLTRTMVALAAVMTVAGLAMGYSSSARPDLGPLSLAALPKPPFDARVLERLSAGSYTYFRVERANHADEWVVTLSSSSGARTLRQGAQLHVTPIGYSEHFASKRLGRVFERLHFAMVRPL